MKDLLCVNNSSAPFCAKAPIKIGEMYEEVSTRQCPCGCGNIEVNIGATIEFPCTEYCFWSHKRIGAASGVRIWWLNSKDFVKLDTVKEEQLAHETVSR